MKLVVNMIMGTMMASYAEGGWVGGWVGGCCGWVKERNKRCALGRGLRKPAGY